MKPLHIDRVVLSVIGPHAGEDIFSIFLRKRDDIARVGHTLWLCHSPATRPNRLQTFFSEYPQRVVLFLTASAKNASRATTDTTAMHEMSKEQKLWQPISAKLSSVTGKSTKGAYAFVLLKLQMLDKPVEIDIWQYATVDSAPVRFKLGMSTLPAIRHDTSTHPLRMQSHIRHVLAVGVLGDPSAVWVK